MATQERLLDVDAVWEMMLQPDYEKKRFYVIDGELFEMSPANRLPGRLAIRIGMFIGIYLEEHNLGEVNSEVRLHTLPTTCRNLACSGCQLS